MLSENPDDPSGKNLSTTFDNKCQSFCTGHHGFWLHTATRHLLDLGVRFRSTILYQTYHPRID
jgi:hypothetical protein